MRRVCCCGGKAPCIGESCCQSEGYGCGIEYRTYHVDLGTVRCDCWTVGFVTPSWPGICSIVCVFGTEPQEYPSPLWAWTVDKCAAGEFEQHSVWTCDMSGVTCPLMLGGSNPFGWERGTITAAFDMVWNGTIDCSIGYTEPFPNGSFTFTNFTGAANANANLCYNHPYGSVTQVEPVNVGASVRPCMDHPCLTWFPYGEFGSAEPFCSDCTGKWDVVTVVYSIANEVQLITHGSAGACNENGAGACWTYDVWTALVRYVRKPVCTEAPEGRSLAGQYVFACAELFIPQTQLWYEPDFYGLGFWNGRTQEMDYDPGQGYPGCGWEIQTGAFCFGGKFKLCERIGYGWEFPEYVTIT